jgi:uncharacterized SAM-binding protein YcdF (DUF218 family)
VNAGEPAEPAPGTPPRRRGMRRALLSACALALLAMPAGFLWFLWLVPNEEVALDRNADCIVVLTGGSSRVADALELLAEGRGKRLLITGVHPTTRYAEIARLTRRYEYLIACCVDLDHSAVNTVGNAVETRRWALARGFASLIVVTSNYHMPRTLAELARQLPQTTLIPFPVVADKQRAERWWANPLAARLMISEYLKYMYAQLRMRLEPVFASEAGKSHLAGK